MAKRFERLQKVTPEEALKMADVKYRNYNLHLQKIKVAFKEILIEIDTAKVEKKLVFQKVKQILEIRPKEKIAYKPPTISILGSPCSNKHIIAKHFNNK